MTSHEPMNPAAPVTHTTCASDPIPAADSSSCPSLIEVEKMAFSFACFLILQGDGF